jgi:hypothetical protein
VENRFDTIKINNAIENPSKFMSKFGTGQLIEDWATSPINCMVALSGINFVLMENGFNSYAIVSNKSADLDYKSVGTQKGTNLALAFALSYVNLSTTSQTKIAGKLYAKDLNQSNVNKMDSVLGAGDLYCDLGLDSFIKSTSNYYYKEADATKRKYNFKQFLQWANVGKNGAGVVMNIEQLKNTAETQISASANINLTGTFANDSKQTGKVVHVITASGSASNWGFQGGVDLTLGRNDDGNTTGLQLAAGASLSANQLRASASDDVNRININGSVQFSESIAIGAALIFSEIERRTRNHISIAQTGGLAIKESIDLDAANTGSITLVSIAGTITKDDPENKEQSGSDDTDYFIGGPDGNEQRNHATDNNRGVLLKLRGTKAENWVGSATGSVGFSILNDHTQICLLWE